MFSVCCGHYWLFSAVWKDASGTVDFELFDAMIGQFQPIKCSDLWGSPCRFSCVLGQCMWRGGWCLTSGCYNTPLLLPLQSCHHPLHLPSHPVCSFAQGKGHAPGCGLDTEALELPRGCRSDRPGPACQGIDPVTESCTSGRLNPSQGFALLAG